MSIDGMFVHKMRDDQELFKMVAGGVPFPMLSDAGGRVGNVRKEWKTEMAFD